MGTNGLRSLYNYDVGGIEIVEMLVYICESFEIIMIVSLSVSIEKHVSAIQQSMILHTVIVTPSLFHFGLPLRVIL